MKAIETRYNGHRFRSRTEARWAVLFDHLGVKYEYEPEGYVLEDGTRYLPDFWMPAEDCFFEVKGVEPSDEEIHKAGLLAYAAQRFVNILIGAPGKHELWVLRPAKRPTPDLLAWIEMAPSDWIRNRVATVLRAGGYALPWTAGAFTTGLDKDPRYAIYGNGELGAKANHRALDYDDSTGHLALWTASISHGYTGREFFDERYGLYDIERVPERVDCYFQALNVPWDQQGELHHRHHDEIKYSPSFYAAIEAAKSARFEFGESGAG